MAAPNLKTALILGDLIGAPGCRAVFLSLKTLIKEHKADVVIVNGENSCEGFGITPEIAFQIWESGAQVITTGNHVWQKEVVFDLLQNDPRILRPANYSSLLPGRGYTTINLGTFSYAVINLQGRKNMPETDDPFSKADEILRKLPKDVKSIFVDFHGEIPEEKEAMGFYLKGRVSAVVGTHTHVQTGDEKILDGKTAYITDLGMCGPMNSVIGSDPKVSIERMVTQLPHRSIVLDAPADIQGVKILFDPATGWAHEIHRLQIPGTL